MTLLRQHPAHRSRHVAERLADAAFYGFATVAVSAVLADRFVSLPGTGQARTWAVAVSALVGVLVGLAVLVRR